MVDHSATPGSLATSLLSEFDAADVSYCVWKGSTHLLASLRGDGDLDLLVDDAHLPAALELHLSSAYRKLGLRSRFQLAAALGSAPDP